jgi:hypothetical protein
MFPFKARNLRRRAEEASTQGSLSIEQLLADQPPREDGQYDIFLSHSTADKSIVLGMRELLASMELRVYVDTVEDPTLSDPTLSRFVATKLRSRMRQSRTLLYIVTENTQRSRWMPWELGYFDGLRGKVGILPVSDGNAPYKPDAFDAFYPPVYMEPFTMGFDDTSINKLFVDIDEEPISFESWLRN